MRKKSLFISFEGIDGVGKSTQVKLLRNWMTKRGFKVFLTREPGGGPLSEKIRRLLLDPKLKMSPLTELLLYEAARAEHVKAVIEPALNKGFVVISDRFMDASTAYQGGARGLTFNFVKRLNIIAAGKTQPDLTILLDLPARLGLSKAISRSKTKKGDRLENEGWKFLEKVRRAYLALAAGEPSRIKVVKVQKTIEATQELIRANVSRKLK